MAQGTHDGPTTAADVREFRPPPRTGVEVSYSGGRATVTVIGVVDRAKVTDVSGTISSLIASGVTELVVDLTHACDGAALLTVLARTRADLADHGGTLWLVGVAVPEFLAALYAAPLEEVFLVYDAVHRDTEGTRMRGRRVWGLGSVQRRTDWPHPSRKATLPDGRSRALQALMDWWIGPEGRGAHRAR